MSDIESMNLWKSGINPLTKRKIKIWGDTWVKLLEKYEWYDNLPDLEKVNKENISAKYLKFVKMYN